MSTVGEQPASETTELVKAAPSQVQTADGQEIIPEPDEELWAQIDKTRFVDAFNPLKIRAKSGFGPWMSTQLQPGFLSINLYESMEELQSSVRLAKQLAANENAPAAIRLAALSAVALISRCLSELTKQTHDMLKPKVEEQKKQPKNLPPPTTGPLIYAESVTLQDASQAKSGA